MIRKLNCGCGARIAAGWTNIDFHSEIRQVQHVNLLRGLPFPANSFDFAYSSHLIEHFTLDEASFLMKEVHRVLKPGGVVRTVVPDLAESVCEYLRILELPDSDPDKATLYNWVKIELLDQLVRTSPGGRMKVFTESAKLRGDSQMLAYISSRTENAACSPGLIAGRKRFIERLVGLSRDKLFQRLTYAYLAVVKGLIPLSLRSMVVSDTAIGEKHRWMYDRYGVSLLMNSVGFIDISLRRFNESAIPGFLEDNLDSNASGFPYKNVSIYCEARKNTV